MSSTEASSDQQTSAVSGEMSSTHASESGSSPSITLDASELGEFTDAFLCGRCKQRKCRYRQAQTRSADEPMSTLITCTVCNNRWKFS